jgi:hypothetical protein
MARQAFIKPAEYMSLNAKLLSHMPRSVVRYSASATVPTARSGLPPIFGGPEAEPR